MSLLDKVYKKSDSIVSRKIADEFILVPIKQNVGDLESIYTLNEVATRVWGLIDGKKKVREIKDKIVEEFEVTPQEAEKDLTNLFKQLMAVGAIMNVQ
ncbi:MAG: PqqD family peptide modification chaperone [Candidatus Aminicenantes bacterium]|nr:PqqD family peptide modification chaperone [Candidatus Aminicenantes bacterium]